MQIITISRKKLGTAIILIGIVVLVLGFTKSFSGKFTSLIKNDTNSLSEYTELNGRIKYKLPAKWQVKKQGISGNEILCHSDFRSNDGKISGFFQVWTFKGDLKTFLKNSKSISDKQNLYKYYSLKDIALDGKRGYLLKYNITKPVGDSYIGEEYFIENRSEFCRFSFFVKENDFKENMSNIFKTIVETLKYN